MTTTRGPRYTDTLYQSAHEECFSKPLIQEIKSVLPPGVSQEDFSRALEELTQALGADAVFSGSDLKEYVDPYEIPEAGNERKLPGAAVW